jgi:zona occludens toxin (predicted ATPase)
MAAVPAAAAMPAAATAVPGPAPATATPAAAAVTAATAAAAAVTAAAALGQCRNRHQRQRDCGHCRDNEFSHSNLHNESEPLTKTDQAKFQLTVSQHCLPNPIRNSVECILQCNSL